MLTTSRKQLIERVIEKDGSFFRVIFAVYFVEGGLRPKIVQVIPLGKFGTEENIIKLPEAPSSTFTDFIFESKLQDSIPSPFEGIFINGSKPRAPTAHI